MEKSLGKHWPWILAFLACLFGLYCVWMVNIPMEKAPDEAVRMILSDYVWRNGKLPNAWDPAVRIYNWGFSYALRPMLVNTIGAGFMAVTSLFTQDQWALVLSVRMVSVISGVVMVLYCFKIAYACHWSEPWMWLFACMAGLMPQIAFLSGYSNNDIFSLMCCTMIIYYWIRGAQTHWSWAECIRLAVVLGLTCLSYYNAYAFVLFSVVFFFGSQIRRNMSKEEWKQIWLKAGAITLITFLLAGWWFIRNIILYDGDVLGSKTRLIQGEMFAIDELRPSRIYKPYREGVSVADMIFKPLLMPDSWISLSFKSMIGVFGSMDNFLPGFVYTLMKWIWALGVLFSAIHWISALFVKDPQERKKLPVRTLFVICLVLSMALVFVMSVIYSYTDDYQPQGRYLIPAFSALIFTIVAGWRWFFQTVFKKVPQEKTRRMLSGSAAVLGCVLMAWLQIYALSVNIIPAYKEIDRLPQYYRDEYWLHQSAEPLR